MSSCVMHPRTIRIISSYRRLSMTTAKLTPRTLEDTSEQITRGARDAHGIIEDARARALANEKLNAFVALPGDEARTHADASNARQSAGALSSMVAGAPIAIADNIVTQL